MEEWDRQTPWRQGQFLRHETAVTLEIYAPHETESKIAIIVSHDCDIASHPDVEPVVEVIVASKIDKVNGSLTHAKSPRRVHLEGVAGDAPFYFELFATAKIGVSKALLFDHDPTSEVSLAPSTLTILQRWLALRYHRAAFPDRFNDFLTDTTRLDKKLVRILEPCGNDVIAVFFDLPDEQSEVEGTSPEEIVYPLSIVLLYSTETDPDLARMAAESAADKITEVFREVCFDKEANSWKYFELEECYAVADTVMTFADSVRLKRWQKDYISLRSDPMQPLSE